MSGYPIQSQPNYEPLDPGGMQPGQAPEAQYNTPLDEAAKFYRALLNQKPAPEQDPYAMIQQNLGPAPSQPEQATKWQKRGAAFQDIGSALGKIMQGFHPRVGQHPVELTNAMGGLANQDEARRQQYYEQMRARNLVGTQMYPSYSREISDNNDKLNYQKLLAANAIEAAESRKQNTAKENRNSAYKTLLSSLAGLWIDPKTRDLWDDPTGEKEINIRKKSHDAYIKKFGADGMEDLAADAARGEALDSTAQQQARMGSGAASQARATDTNRGLAQSDTLNIDQIKTARMIYSKHIEDGLKADAARVTGGAFKEEKEMQAYMKQVQGRLHSEALGKVRAVFGDAGVAVIQGGATSRPTKSKPGIQTEDDSDINNTPSDPNDVVGEADPSLAFTPVGENAWGTDEIAVKHLKATSASLFQAIASQDAGTAARILDSFGVKPSTFNTNDDGSPATFAQRKANILAYAEDHLEAVAQFIENTGKH